MRKIKQRPSVNQPVRHIRCDDPHVLVTSVLMEQVYQVISSFTL